MAGPALPWACPDTPANDGSAPSKDQKELSLKAGDRVKVLWEIHSDEGESSTKWWGASVMGDVDAARARATLRYDALGEFEEEEVEVVFLSCELLKDCGSEAEMHWGREEDIDDDEEEEEEGNRHMEEEVGLQELCTLLGQPGAQREDPSEMERQAMQHLQHLPMDKQLQLAEGFRSFVNHVSGQIKAKAEASGEQTYVVTGADVSEIVGGFGLPQK